MSQPAARPLGGGGGGGRPPTFPQDQFCNLPNMIKKTVRGWGGCNKDLKSSHQTGQTFHNSYNNDIQFSLFAFLQRKAQATTSGKYFPVQTSHSVNKPLIYSTGHV